MSVPPTSSRSSSRSAWKNPSHAHLQKYGLVALPGDFEPTAEEQLLLGTYATIQTIEKQANKLKEEAARAKLAKLQEQYEAKTQTKKKRIRVKKEREAESDNEDGDDDEEDDENEDEDEDEADNFKPDRATLAARREAKLAALREEVEEAKQKESQEDVLREALLQTRDDVDVPLLKRKRIDVLDTADNPSSLIANLTATGTPPHEFSKSLGLTVGRGKVLFPTSTESGKWTPPAGVFSPNDGAFMVELEDFDEARAHNGQGNNTLAIKFMAPSDSKRFSVNIAAPDHNNFDSVLFHFNPRQYERGGQLVINGKESGIWGQAVNIPLTEIPLIFGQTSCTLIIQVNAEGFDVFIEDKHCARLEHRYELPPGNTKLVLQFPSTDDYGNPENWAVYKVWWGNRPVMAKADVSGVAGVNSYNAYHPRKLFVSQLPKIFSEAEVDLRRAELERAFRKYGGDRGVQVVVPVNATYAFVEMESERQAESALNEMSSKYRLNRAKRSRREALREERAARDAAASSGVASKETSDWD